MSVKNNILATKETEMERLYKRTALRDGWWCVMALFVHSVGGGKLEPAAGSLPFPLGRYTAVLMSSSNVSSVSSYDRRSRDPRGKSERQKVGGFRWKICFLRKGLPVTGL